MRTLVARIATLVTRYHGEATRLRPPALGVDMPALPLVIRAASQHALSDQNALGVNPAPANISGVGSTSSWSDSEQITLSVFRPNTTFRDGVRLDEYEVGRQLLRRQRAARTAAADRFQCEMTYSTG